MGSDEGCGVGDVEIVGLDVGNGDGTADGTCVSTDTPVTESDDNDESPADEAAEVIDDASAPDDAAALIASLISLTNAPLSSDATVCALAVIVTPSATPALSCR